MLQRQHENFAATFTGETFDNGSVSGRRIVTVLPLPAVLAISTMPRSMSMFRRTTSSPTPRPERSVTDSRLRSRPEKRARKYLFAELIFGGDKSSANRFLKNRARSNPLHHLQLYDKFPPLCEAVADQAARILAFAFRALPLFQAMIDRIRTRCTEDLSIVPAP